MNQPEVIKTYEERIQSLQSELNTYQNRCEQYAQAYDSLLSQIRDL